MLSIVTLSCDPWGYDCCAPDSIYHSTCSLCSVFQVHRGPFLIFFFALPNFQFACFGNFQRSSLCGASNEILTADSLHTYKDNMNILLI